jgi:hypothetical protein
MANFDALYPSKDYPVTLRRIVVKHPNPNQQRWQVELFFKWIKQHLRTGRFWREENAYTQIWIAVCTYVLIAIIKKRLKFEHSLYENPTNPEFDDV